MSKRDKLRGAPNLSLYVDRGFAADSDSFQDPEQPVRQKRGTGRRLRALMERMRAAAASAEKFPIMVLAIQGLSLATQSYRPAPKENINIGIEHVEPLSPITELGSLGLEGTQEVLITTDRGIGRLALAGVTNEVIPTTQGAVSSNVSVITRQPHTETTILSAA